MIREPRDGQHQGSTCLLVIALSAGLALTTAACGYLLLRDRGGSYVGAVGWLGGAIGSLCAWLAGTVLTSWPPLPPPPTHTDTPPRLGGKRRRGDKAGPMPVEGSEVFPPLPEPVVALLQVPYRWWCDYAAANAGAHQC